MLSKKLKKKLYLKNKPDIFSKTYWPVKFVNKLMQRGRKTNVKKNNFTCV